MSLPLIHSTSDNNDDLSVLTLNVHYNSSLLSPSGDANGFSAIENTFSNSLLDDGDNKDKDPLTDKIVQLSWVDLASEFTSGELPASLGTLRFKKGDQAIEPLTEEGLNTNVRYTASGTATDYGFLTGNTTLEAKPFSLDGDGLMVIVS